MVVVKKDILSIMPVNKYLKSLKLDSLNVVFSYLFACNA